MKIYNTSCNLFISINNEEIITTDYSLSHKEKYILQYFFYIGTREQCLSAQLILIVLLI